MRSIVDKMKLADAYPVGTRVQVCENGVWVVDGIVDAVDVIGETLVIRDSMQTLWHERVTRPGLTVERIDDAAR